MFTKKRKIIIKKKKNSLALVINIYQKKMLRFNICVDRLHIQMHNWILKYWVLSILLNDLEIKIVKSGKLMPVMTPCFMCQGKSKTHYQTKTRRLPTYHPLKQVKKLRDFGSWVDQSSPMVSYFLQVSPKDRSIIFFHLIH